MSATVWSRCRSTNEADRSPSTNHTGSTAGRPSPPAVPTVSSHGGPSPGRKQARSSSYRTDPPIPRQSPRFGFQPPETRRLSFSSASGGASVRAACTSTPAARSGSRESTASPLVVTTVTRSSGTDAEPVHVGRSGGGEHHAGTVVPGERDGTLGRAGREDHAFPPAGARADLGRRAARAPRRSRRRRPRGPSSSAGWRLRPVGRPPGDARPRASPDRRGSPPPRQRRGPIDRHRSPASRRGHAGDRPPRPSLPQRAGVPRPPATPPPARPRARPSSPRRSGRTRAR